ncbi:hypothetical protein MesoLjLb_69800 [Mesorhizobium sp. L-8-3]|nr:hypothetical protein MesoLjLb_69800 [Mesorhizobium sp. L-8-3]
MRLCDRDRSSRSELRNTSDPKHLARWRSEWPCRPEMCLAWQPPPQTIVDLQILGACAIWRTMYRSMERISLLLMAAVCFSGVAPDFLQKEMQEAFDPTLTLKRGGLV